MEKHLVVITDSDGYTLMEIVSTLTTLDRETYLQTRVVPLLPAITLAFDGGPALIYSAGNTEE